jgi:hypothetical protein
MKSEELTKGRDFPVERNLLLFTPGITLLPYHCRDLALVKLCRERISNLKHVASKVGMLHLERTRRSRSIRRKDYKS